MKDLFIPSLVWLAFTVPLIRRCPEIFLHSAKLNNKILRFAKLQVTSNSLYKFLKFRRNPDNFSVSLRERAARKNLRKGGINLAIFSKRDERVRVFYTLSFLRRTIPYALRLLNANITKKSSVSKFDAVAESDAALGKKLDGIEKQLLEIFLAGRASVSVFELREVLERYSGLTLAARETDEIGGNESEVFKISNHANAKLGAKCLHRRNRLRLEFHQRLASRDFLKLLAKFSFSEAEKLRRPALEFATLLNDGETRRAIENLFAESSQNRQSSAVKQGEKEVVWNAAQHKPPLAKPISVPITSRSMIATANSSNKD